MEETDSPLGRYRLVFSTTAPLPPGTDSEPGVSFVLDDQRLRVVPIIDPTLFFGYAKRRPGGQRTLELIRAARQDTAGESRSQLTFSADALLAHGRPRRGEFEAAHIQRSADSTDLLAAWDASTADFVGVLMRYDSHPDTPEAWRLWFSLERSLRGNVTPDVAGNLILELPRHDSLFEIGGRYLVFLSRGAASQPDRVNAVRIWWPKQDSVLQFVETWFDIPGAANRDPSPGGMNRRAFLFAALASPAAEVRRSAAAQLARMEVRNGRLTPDERRLIAARLAKEPSDVVKKSLATLSPSGAAGSRPD